MNCVLHYPLFEPKPGVGCCEPFSSYSAMYCKWIRGLCKYNHMLRVHKESCSLMLLVAVKRKISSLWTNLAEKFLISWLLENSVQPGITEEILSSWTSTKRVLFFVWVDTLKCRTSILRNIIEAHVMHNVVWRLHSTNMQLNCSSFLIFKMWI